MCRPLLAVLSVAMVSACHANPSVESPVSPRNVVMKGLLTSLWGDPQGASPQLLLHLTDDAGRTVALEIPDSVLEAAGGLAAVNNRRVEISGVQFSAGTAVTTRVQAIKLAHEPEPRP